LRPWTIPNAIVFARFLGIPVFLAFALTSLDGRDTTAAVLFAVLCWGDYADGIAARVTRQYSRLGTLLDPLVDRLVVLSGLAVCFHYATLPRWALVVLFARELFMLALARYGLKRGVDLKINWWGRAGVWPTMSAPFWAFAGVDVLARISLYLGLAMTLVATALYIREGRRQTAGGVMERPSSST